MHARRSFSSSISPNFSKRERAKPIRFSFQGMDCFTKVILPSASILSSRVPKLSNALDFSMALWQFSVIFHHSCQLQPTRDQPHSDCGPFGKIMKRNSCRVPCVSARPVEGALHGLLYGLRLDAVPLEQLSQNLAQGVGGDLQTLLEDWLQDNRLVFE
eukprot:UN0754